MLSPTTKPILAKLKATERIDSRISLLRVLGRIADDKAFEALKGAEKADPECLSCHATGYGEPFSEKTTVKDLRGVQCEACHGPGSEYKSMRVMKDPKLARKNGLLDITRETCLRCHR